MLWSCLRPCRWCRRSDLSTADQTHSARIHGEALRLTSDLVGMGYGEQDPDTVAALRRLAALTDDPAVRSAVGLALAHWALDDLLGDREEMAYHLIAAGLVLSSGVLDYDVLARSPHGEVGPAPGPRMEA